MNKPSQLIEGQFITQDLGDLQFQVQFEYGILSIVILNKNRTNEGECVVIDLESQACDQIWGQITDQIQKQISKP